MKKLKELRLKTGLTGFTVANTIGISAPFYSQLENNQRRLSYKMAVKIAEVFNLKPDDLFYEETKESN